ncbi:MAG: hypothetical protein R3D46_16080 [Defluviimonas denitrificans]
MLSIRTDDPGLFSAISTAKRSTRRGAIGSGTGDIVMMDEDGALHSLGRGDDMINAGGFRVSPAEIEAAMNAHPDVTACAAIALPVRQDVEVIALAYTGGATEGALQAHAETSLHPT